MLENVHNKILGEFPVGLQLGFQPFIAMTWVQSLAVELRSHKLCGTAKKKKRAKAGSNERENKNEETVQTDKKRVISEGEGHGKYDILKTS